MMERRKESGLYMRMAADGVRVIATVWNGYQGANSRKAIEAMQRAFPQAKPYTLHGYTVFLEEAEK